MSPIGLYLRLFNFLDFFYFPLQLSVPFFPHFSYNIPHKTNRMKKNLMVLTSKLPYSRNCTSKASTTTHHFELIKNNKLRGHLNLNIFHPNHILPHASLIPLSLLTIFHQSMFYHSEAQILVSIFSKKIKLPENLTSCSVF